MCLRASSNKIQKAEQDIVCYKILVKEEMMDAQYRTPYMNFPVHNGYISGKLDFGAHKPTKLEEPSVIMGRKHHKYRVAEGFIHTYANIKSAKKQALYISNFTTNNCEVFECIIPKGVEYYEGIDCTLSKSYASSKIRFVNKIK